MGYKTSLSSLYALETLFIYYLLLFLSAFEWNGSLALLCDFYAICGATSLHNVLAPFTCMFEA